MVRLNCAELLYILRFYTLSHVAAVDSPISCQRVYVFEASKASNNNNNNKWHSANNWNFGKKMLCPKWMQSVIGKHLGKKYGKLKRKTMYVTTKQFVRKHTCIGILGCWTASVININITHQNPALFFMCVCFFYLLVWLVGWFMYIQKTMVNN